MSLTRWLVALFLAGFLTASIGAALVAPVLLILAGFALMLPAPTLAAMAAIERRYQS